MYFSAVFFVAPNMGTAGLDVPLSLVVMPWREHIRGRGCSSFTRERSNALTPIFAHCAWVYARGGSGAVFSIYRPYRNIVNCCRWRLFLSLMLPRLLFSYTLPFQGDSLQSFPKDPAPARSVCRYNLQPLKTRRKQQ